MGDRKNRTYQRNVEYKARMNLLVECGLMKLKDESLM